MELIEISSLDHLNEVTANNANALIIVSRNACPGCDALMRALNTNADLQSALDGVQVAVAKLEKIPTIAQTFGLRQAPSMLLFKDDEEVTRVTGFMQPAPLLAALRGTYQAVSQAA